MTDVRPTHIGGPTVLIQVGGWRLLTDPTIDPPGAKYNFGWGTGSVKVVGPAVAASELGQLDAVLLTHDHHDDNLDPAGRALLSAAGSVVTTVSGSRRIGGETRGLEPWGTTVLEAPGRPPIEVTATPWRHGPPLSRPLAGDRRPPVDRCGEGWKHFKEGREAIERELEGAPREIRERIRWLPLGVDVEIAA